MFSFIPSRWRIAVESALVVMLIVCLKALAERFDAEFISLNPLFTSVIAGGIFLFGLILAGTMADYKESEKIPAEIASACESIYAEGRSVKEAYSSFDLTALVDRLTAVIEGFMSDVRDHDSRKALSALSRLSDSWLEMERTGIPPNYIVRLKSEESLIRRNILRVYYIQKINFLPSAFMLVESIVALIMVLLVFTKIEPFFDAVVITIFLTYIFTYVLKLLKTLDKPFRANEDTRDDVSLFLLRELEERINAR